MTQIHMYKHIYIFIMEFIQLITVYKPSKSHLECEEVVGVMVKTKHESRAGICVCQEFLHSIPEPLEEKKSWAGPQDEICKHKLEEKPSYHWSPIHLEKKR